MTHLAWAYVPISEAQQIAQLNGALRRVPFALRSAPLQAASNQRQSSPTIISVIVTIGVRWHVRDLVIAIVLPRPLMKQH